MQLFVATFGFTSVRAGAHPPREINLVAEYNPPFRYSTVIQAELAWGTDESYDQISSRALRNAQSQTTAK